jgi:hypothetical protein
MSEPVIQAMPGIVTLTIQMNQATRQIGVQGPIEDKLFCYGLLEMAKEAIAEHHKQQQGKILVARPAPGMMRQ